MKGCLIVVGMLIPGLCAAQPGEGVQWARDGHSYFRSVNGEIRRVSLTDDKEQVIVPRTGLTIQSFTASADGHAFLLYTNSKRVWRYDTRGDYWVYQSKDSSLHQLGKSLPPSSLMFAKISPDGAKVAYVSGNNIFLEDLSDHEVTQLTFDRDRKLINGTFDYLYEEEFDCRDGFRWSPDGKHIAFWQIDARGEKDYLLLNTTDSAYSFSTPVTYATPGERPALCRIGVIGTGDHKTQWIHTPVDTLMGFYIPRMEWADNNTQLVVQYLNRRQDDGQIMLCDIADGFAHTVYTEHDSAWIDIQPEWDDRYKMGGWDWLRNGSEFLWVSERDGWRHLYRVSRDGKKAVLLTRGPYDVMGLCRVDEKGGYVYFMASPENATQAYLYRVRLSGAGDAERVTPGGQVGTHTYDISPDATYAVHTFSNHYTFPLKESITLPDHKPLGGQESFETKIARAAKSVSNLRFFTIQTADGAAMDGWMVRPEGFDSSKKYPVVFFVYGGPAEQTVTDNFGVAGDWLYHGNMAKDGYIYISVDNRGTPVAKGRAWRKHIYGKLGQSDVADQADAAREILHWPFVDSTRTAVWGWSHGGTVALNLILRHPDLYGTCIAIAPITNFLYYDNIYTERVMGLPGANMQGYLEGSPVTYAKNLTGNLLLINGSGDDNVHPKHMESLLNELIKSNKVFQYMEYPNRTHNISEGAGTSRSLSSLYTAFLRAHCVPGGR